MKANGSKSVDVTFTTRRETCPRPYKEPATPPRGRCQVSWTTPWQETCLAQRHFRNTETNRNHPHQIVLVTRTQMKTIHKQQTSHTKKKQTEPIWTYRTQLWDTASISKIKILECFQSQRCWSLFYIPLYKFLRNLLNVLVQIANKMGI
jgi:hypothetical protein